MQKINCNYGTPCIITAEEKDGQKVLKFDFNIVSYKYFEQGWHDKYFPANIVINDKLYLNEQILDKLLVILNKFITTGEIDSPEGQYTDRGFTYMNLKDIDDNKISIQKSSSAMDEHIWFGCNTNNQIFTNHKGNLTPYNFTKRDCVVSARLHLSQEKAQELKRAIMLEWAQELKPAPISTNPRFKF